MHGIEDEPIVALRDVTKRYKRMEILSGLSLNLRRGQIAAIVGANGSGKSTLLRLIAGLSTVSGGERRLAAAAKPIRIGYAPDRLPLLRFTAREYLTHMAAIGGLDSAAAADTIDRYLERFKLNGAGRTQMRHFSKGMLQKVNLIQSVLREPDLWLLDEPYSGLDPDMRDELTGLLQEARERGAAVVVASHDREWVRGSADRCLTLDGGKFVADETIDRIAVKSREIVCALTAHAASSAAAERYLRLDGVLRGRREGDRLRLCADARRSDDLLRTLLGEGVSIVSVGEEKLEEVAV